MSEIITPGQKAFVIQTIRSVLSTVEILAFGSRIQGGAKKYSDLDVALKDKARIPLKDLSKLDEVFKNSQLPFKIDLLDYERATPEFQQLIKNTAVPWL